MSYREGSKGGNTPTWTSQRKSSHIYRILTPLGKNLVLSYLFLFLPCFRGEKKINQELAIFLLVQSTYLLNYIIDWTTRMDWLLSRFSVSSQPTHSQFSSPPLPPGSAPHLHPMSTLPLLLPSLSIFPGRLGVVNNVYCIIGFQNTETYNPIQRRYLSTNIRHVKPNNR